MLHMVKLTNLIIEYLLIDSIKLFPMPKRLPDFFGLANGNWGRGEFSMHNL